MSRLSNRKSWSLSATCLFAFAVFGAGCGRPSWQAKTQPAHGEVIVNGKPADGAFVTLYPVGKDVDSRQSRPWSIVEPDGSYTLRTYELDDGAPIGEYQVTVVWRFDPSSQAVTDRLGFAYSKPEQTPWRFTIKSGDNELPRIDIKDNQVAASPVNQRVLPPPPFNDE